MCLASIHHKENHHAKTNENVDYTNIVYDGGNGGDFPPPPARATVIVDTGPGASNGYFLSSHQWLGGQFNLTKTTTTTDVEGWISTTNPTQLTPHTYTGGTAYLNVYSDTSSLPGAQLFQQAFSIPATTPANWQGIHGISLNLTPGTYWATFEAPQGSSLDALMPFPSPQPLSKYAFSSAYPYMTHNPLDFFGPPILHPAGEWSPMSLPSLNGLGLRIEGQSLLAPLTALQLALFSDAAYGSATAVAGYSEISLGTFSSQQGSGFGAKAFLDNSGSRIVLAFAGTDDLLDLIGADSAFLKSQPTDTLKSYVSYATTVVQFLAEKNPGVEITFTGHSLGGAIAQIIAKATGSNATTFDAPGAKQFLPYLTTELSLLPPLPKPSGTQQITNYRVYGDLVSTVGTQLGATKTYEPPVNAHIVDAFPIGAAKSMHLLGTIIERIVNNAPIAVSSGPSAASAGGTLLKTVLKPSILGVIRQGVNGVVLAGDAFFIDPQDVDAYGLAADAGSPLFRSVTFPFLLDLDAVFRLEEFDNGLWVSDGLFDELSTYDFGLGGGTSFASLSLIEITCCHRSLSSHSLLVLRLFQMVNLVAP